MTLLFPDSCRISRPFICLFPALHTDHPVLTTEPRRLFSACAWRLLPLSEAKTRLLSLKLSLSLRWLVAFHLPSSEVFAGCFCFLPGEVLAGRAALGSSGSGPRQVVLQSWPPLQLCDAGWTCQLHDTGQRSLLSGCSLPLLGLTKKYKAEPGLQAPCSAGRADGQKASEVMGVNLLFNPRSLSGAGFGLQPLGFAPFTARIWN